MNTDSLKRYLNKLIKEDKFEDALQLLEAIVKDSKTPTILMSRLKRLLDDRMNGIVDTDNVNYNTLRSNIVNYYTGLRLEDLIKSSLEIIHEFVSEEDFRTFFSKPTVSPSYPKRNINSSTQLMNGLKFTGEIFLSFIYYGIQTLIKLIYGLGVLIALAAALALAIGFVFSPFIIIHYLSQRSVSHKPIITYSSDSTVQTIDGIEGLDHNGKKITYVGYFIRGCKWKIGHKLLSECGEERQTVCDVLSSKGVIAHMNHKKYKGIICIGNASHEMKKQILLAEQQEEERAEARAKQLANCINPNLEVTTPVYILNLGRFMFSKLADIEDQRGIYVLGVVFKEEGAIEEEALYDALKTEHWERRFPINIDHFSRVDTVGKVDLTRYLH